VSTAKLLILLGVFFITSMISVVTGSTSLLTVPVMISLGIEPHAAVATNMLALVFMSVGGSLSFIGRGVISHKYLPISILLTVVGSGLGALLLLAFPVRALQLCIALAMITVIVFTLARPDMAFQNIEAPLSRRRILAGYLLTLLLAVYGGFFSGGYVTVLTAGWIVLFGMTFLQSVATTKVVNIFSSLVATLIFVHRGVVNVRLGITLGLIAFGGALLGGRLALRLSAIWLRRIFLMAVFGLAIKMLLPTH
jgi:uncharacterized membrane protein YfcA